MSFVHNINHPISIFHHETIVVGTTAVQLPNNPEASWVQITHEDAGAKIYLGGNDTLTVANGWGALTLDDTTERYPVVNLNKLWLVSDTADTVVRLLWGE
jgi:hypothetical protein